MVSTLWEIISQPFLNVDDVEQLHTKNLNIDPFGSNSSFMDRVDKSACVLITSLSFCG